MLQYTSTLQSTLLASLSILIEIITWSIFIRVILSWVIPYQQGNNPFVKIVYAITEPILGPARQLLDRMSFARNLPIDFSPWVAMLLLQYVVYPILRAIIIRLPF